jgi:molybdopterin-binding protein
LTPASIFCTGDRIAGCRILNGLPGVVTEVSLDRLMAQVELVSIDPLRVVSVITRDSAEDFDFAAASWAVTAVIKSTSFMVQR